MNRNYPKFKINKLVINGERKDYIINFHNGLNIIYGDSDTGKSSILNLIDYCLGSSEVYMYDELQYSANYCFLEVILNKKTYTIKRNIFKNTDNIEVFYSDYEHISDIFPLEFGPNYSKSGEAGFFSDFLLNALNIPLIKVKQAPSKSDSKVIRVGFRDIFKFCYLDQDDVGSKYILDSKNGSVFTKNKETFKFIHNVLDTQISEVTGEIAEKNKKKNELCKKYDTLNSFFYETQFETEKMLQDEILELNNQIESIRLVIDSLNEDMLSSTGYFNGTREVIKGLEEKIQELEEKNIILQRNNSQNQKLLKEYDKDIQKLETILKSNIQLKKYSNNKIICPVCHKTIDNDEIKKEFIESDNELVKKEKNSLKRRRNGLSNLIDENINEIYLLALEKQGLLKDLDTARKLLDSGTKDIISPFIVERDALITQYSKLKEEKEKYIYFLKIRNQIDIILEEIRQISDQVNDLNEKLDVLKEKAPSIEKVLGEIGYDLNEFLKFIKIKNAVNIFISENTFLPKVRNKDYTKLTSGGLRTLVSVGYYISLLKNNISLGNNLPSILMIDTIGKYLGKTKDKYIGETDILQDRSEGITDPEKYLKIYEYLINMTQNIEEDKEFQIIIVDNDIPLEIEKLVTKYTVKRFSNQKKSGFSIGLIDDIDLI